VRIQRLLIWAAWLAYVAAWFLPIVKEGATLPDGLPGWQAFRVATCAVWPCADISIDKWYKAVLFTISAVTTVLFIPVSLWAVSSGLRALRRAFAWVATSAFIVNAHWYVLYGGSARQDLRIGYFLWWLSFLLVALGLFDLPRRETSKQ